MYAARYFAPRYFAPRFWPQVGAELPADTTTNAAPGARLAAQAEAVRLVSQPEAVRLLATPGPGVLH